MTGHWSESERDAPLRTAFCGVISHYNGVIPWKNSLLELNSTCTVPLQIVHMYFDPIISHVRFVTMTDGTFLVLSMALPS